MASTQERKHIPEQTQTSDNSTESVSCALLDAVAPENITDMATDPGKSNANGSANDAAMSSVESTRTPEQIEELKKKILTQVEYYFGDKNLPNDKFLNEVRSKNPQGWVPLKMICKFKKMQVYKDYDLIIEALRESPNLLEVDEQGEHVRRKTLVMIDIPQHIKDSPIWRSIYVKGFNKDEIDTNYEKEVASYFSQYGKVEKAFARRDDDNTYKDSFFIQFATHEEAKKVSEMDISYKNVKLTMMMKFDYCEMKCVEKGLDPNTMRLQKQQITKKEKRPSKKWNPGCLLHFEDAGPKSTYLTIRSQMQNHFGDVKYVQYDPKNSSGVIEFEHPIDHKIIESTPSDKLEFDGIKPKFRILEGDEEKDYYQKKKNEFFEKSKQSNALKAEFGINSEESSGNNTNKNVRGKGRGRGTTRGRGNGRKEKQHTGGKKRKTESQDKLDDDVAPTNREKQSESGGQKRKQDGSDDVAADDLSPTKKSRSEKVLSEDDDASPVEEKQHVESTGQVKLEDEPEDDVGGRSTKEHIVPEVLSSSLERKRKAIDLNDSDELQERPPKSPNLEIADE
ncbi:hypothetical protein RhiirA5_345311 [Rhizophagus irregularis]|uniref:Uncharacterized protein n=1 Tax=Rhizophagus irregularis TaxID=588596 RepID=A0A2N0QFY4_9GLOM|nr:hypothetical protein RhiirA5_345311 [Rhizophagus irregularis]CAB5169702.1 unnamed protein product [Rhizophagus irregularis]